MWESIKSKNVWFWHASGKHPVTRDFISLGQDQPIFRAFSDWVQKGYRMHASTRGARTHACSWRFWARGLKKEDLVCGLVRDSCDLLGRPHPLLVIGTGALGGWEIHWDLLPLACNSTWSQIEHLSAKRHEDIAQFYDDLQLSSPPSSEWKAFEAVEDALQVSIPSDPGASNPDSPEDVLLRKKDFQGIDGEAERMLKRDKFFIPLETGADNKLLAMINMLHRHLKSILPAPPNAVFMGGSPLKNYLMVIYKPIAQDDFSRLWTHCT